MPLSPGLYLINTLISFFPSIRNARINVWTSNVTLPEARENGSCRSSLVKKEFKNIEEMSRAENFPLHLKYVPSNENIADAPSCTFSDIDCFLSEEAWARVSSEVWTTDVKHDVFNSNCRRGRNTSLLAHYLADSVFFRS